MCRPRCTWWARAECLSPRLACARHCSLSGTSDAARGRPSHLSRMAVRCSSKLKSQPSSQRSQPPPAARRSAGELSSLMPCFRGRAHQIFDAYFAKKGLPKGALKFLFDGNQLKDTDTPEDVRSNDLPPPPHSPCSHQSLPALPLPCRKKWRMGTASMPWCSRRVRVAANGPAHLLLHLLRASHMPPVVWPLCFNLSGRRILRRGRDPRCMERRQGMQESHAIAVVTNSSNTVWVQHRILAPPTPHISRPSVSIQ